MYSWSLLHYNYNYNVTYNTIINKTCIYTHHVNQILKCWNQKVTRRQGTCKTLVVIHVARINVILSQLCACW